MAGVLNLKLTFCFMEITRDLLHLDKQRKQTNKEKKRQSKIMDMPISFICIIIF
jgi:hypothetical protein